VAASVRYEVLVQQISTLRRHFLPALLSPTGTYHRPDRVSANALGFRILSVAEIESYIEDRCIQIAKAAQDSWKTSQTYSLPLQNITVFSPVKYDPPAPYIVPKPKDQKDWDNLLSSSKRIERAVGDYIYQVEEENHGIKERNLLSMLTPVGIDLRLLDPTFINRIDALGGKRGDAAHSSCSKALKVGVDPRAELKDVEDVLRDLLDLDGRLDIILASALAPEQKQTTYLVVPAARGPAAKALIKTLPGELQIQDHPEIEGEVAFSLTYPVSYEAGLSYGIRLAEFAKRMGGKRELPAKFQ
jgi:hypothetical protein